MTGKYFRIDKAITKIVHIIFKNTLPVINLARLPKN